MANAGRTLDPVKAVNESLPANERIQLGQRIEDLSQTVNYLIDTINAAGVTGLTLDTSQKVTPPSEM